MQLVSPAPGSLATARTYLVNAQAAAANVVNQTAGDTLVQLQAGVQQASRAAAELLLAEPRSQFQDLVAARTHVLEGQQQLERAVSAWASAHGVDHTPVVKQFASEAFDAFEAAFEIIDND